MACHGGVADTPIGTVRVLSVGLLYYFRIVMGIITSGFVALSAFFWLIFAIAYKTPAKKPTPTAETDPKVTGSPKNIIPDAATGNLLSAPVML